MKQLQSKLLIVQDPMIKEIEITKNIDSFLNAISTEENLSKIEKYIQNSATINTLLPYDPLISKK